MSITVGTLNSVSIVTTTATLNITPPAVEAAYDLIQVLYKKHGISNFTVGVTYVGVQGVAGNVDQTGLEANTLYDFCITTADSSSRYSLPSPIISAIGTVFASENNLFVANAITLLANCTTFIDWIGGTTSAHARERINNKELSAINENQRLYFPCANVYFENDISNQVDTHLFIKNVTIKIQFLTECSAEKTRNEPELLTSFMDTIGKINQELESLNGVDSYLHFKSLSLQSEPMFAGLTQMEDDQETKTDLIMVTTTLLAGF